MSELPERPNLDQLRRQARELLRAADAGEPQAVRRLRAVSGRRTLSVAQLAVAREYGFSSWPALHAEVGRRRLSAPAADTRAGPSLSIPAALAAARWSVGGAAVIAAGPGTLTVTAIIIGPDHAFADAWLEPSADTERQLAGRPAQRLPGVRFVSGALAMLGRRQRRWQSPEFGDVTVGDDRGARYALAVEAMMVPRAVRGRVRGPIWLRLSLDPAPPPDCSWIDLHGPGGAAARLLPSPRPQVRVTGPAPAAGTEADRELASLALGLISIRLDIGADPDADTEQFLTRECSAVQNRVTELREQGRLSPDTDLPGRIAQLADVLASSGPADDLPDDWAGILAAAGATDGPTRHLDLAAYVPAPEGIGVQLDTLVSQPAGWQVHLRAAPDWWEVSRDQRGKREALSVTAEDDLGGTYACNPGPASGHDDHCELTLQFRPRLNPQARTVRLTFTGHSEEGAAQIALADS